MAKSKNTAAAYAALERELAEARAYQAAIDEVLQLVGAAPTDLRRHRQARHRLMRRQRGAGHAL